MKTKQISPEKSAKKQLRKEKELRYWEKQKARPKGNTYFWYLVLIIAMIYADSLFGVVNNKKEVVNEKTLRIICNNFENSLGEGLRKSNNFRYVLTKLFLYILYTSITLIYYI